MRDSGACEVRLRDVEDADLDPLFAHQADIEAVQMVGFASRDREAFLAHWAKIRADSAVFLRTVVVDERVTGHVVCWEQSGQHVVGYWLGREYWGRGIATKALLLLVDQVASRPLYARVALHNLGSLRVLEKCGFQPAREVATRLEPDQTDGIEDVLLVLSA